MPQNEAARIDPLVRGPFSRLLLSDSDTLMGFNRHTTSGTFTFSSDQKPPKMLCFGQDYINSNGKINGGSTTTTTDDKSSTTNSTTTFLSSNSNMKRNLESEYYQPVNVSTSFTTTEATVAPPVRTTRRNHKKMKTENTPPATHAKVKKEKLGERIAALQQMVSPYGKTDTASVLHEAMGYIKSLQEQVHVLWSPYLKRLPTTHIEGKEDRGGERKKDLRSQGLCLVPFDCTHHVAESNGDDLWSPVMVNRQGGSSALH